MANGENYALPYPGLRYEDGEIGYADKQNKVGEDLDDIAEFLDNLDFSGDLTDLQQQIEVLQAGNDVVDVVATKAALDAYNAQHLVDGDTIKVMADETEDGKGAYYRWVSEPAPGHFDLIGTEGPYITTSQLNTALTAYQQKLVPGDGVTINNSTNTISFAGATVWHGTTAPTSELGANGDLYVQYEEGA